MILLLTMQIMYNSISACCLVDSVGLIIKFFRFYYIYIYAYIVRKSYRFWFTFFYRRSNYLLKYQKALFLHY